MSEIYKYEQLKFHGIEAQREETDMYPAYEVVGYIEYWKGKAEYWEKETRKLQERLDASQNVVNALDERLDVANQRVNAVEDQSVKQVGLYLSLNKMETDLGKLREAIGTIKFNEILTDGE